MVYCFDLDGTLCNTDGNNYKDSTPKEERIEIVNTLYDEGHNYFFFTMEQLKSWGVKFHTLRTGVKFGADIFIDDKGIRDERFFKI